MGEHEGEARIYAFPVKVKNCGECEHAALSSSGVFCLEYREEIYDETVANECEAYEEPFIFQVKRRT